MSHIKASLPAFSIKLDLGAGDVVPEGYTPIGRKTVEGIEFAESDIYPLPHADNSVDVIRASHVLEHFPYREVPNVLKDWVRALKPGGILRVAVPNFEHLAESYLAGRGPGIVATHEMVLMGGQANEDDYHKSIFDQYSLKKLFADAGLVLLKPWQSEVDDCARYELSLNLEGTKPSVSEMRVSAAMSVPRLGFMDNFGCVIDALFPLGIKVRRQGGAFWGQALTNCMEIILEDDKPDLILTLDYDTVFTKANVAQLIQLMMAHPEVDALAALQSSRHLPTALFTVMGEDGKARGRISTEEFEPDLKQIHTAHFGLTLIRAEKLRNLPKPWFIATPDKDGRWQDVRDGQDSGDGKIDEDISFWKHWKDAGNSLYLANHVVIGHAELMVRWPGKDFQAIFQPMREFTVTGKAPEGTWS